MRHIPINELEEPDGWRDDAAAALAAVEVYAGAERKIRNAEIERYAAKTWRALKDALMKLSDEKCWYCEIRQDRSLGAVDHYRPKGKVHEAPTHPGYWWLAFDKTNCRFTCTFCNSATTDRKSGQVGGKCDQFPLFDETKRATTPTSNPDDESPKLLDPVEALDPTLLTWMVDGSSAPRYSASQNDEWRERAEVTIAVYHLNHHRLRRRRTQIYNELKMLIREGDILYEKAVTDQPYEMASMKRVTRGIVDRISERAELTATARQYILEYRTAEPHRSWLEGVIASA
jgi:uncharacterized protein (TIGR02646 family)